MGTWYPVLIRVGLLGALVVGAEAVFGSGVFADLAVLVGQLAVESLAAVAANRRVSFADRRRGDDERA